MYDTAGHGLQWLWPFMLAYEPGKTAILDDICIVHPLDELQQSLQTALRELAGSPTTPDPQAPSTSWLPSWSHPADNATRQQVFFLFVACPQVTPALPCAVLCCA